MFHISSSGLPLPPHSSLRSSLEQSFSWEININSATSRIPYVLCSPELKFLVKIVLHSTLFEPDESSSRHDILFLRYIWILSFHLRLHVSSDLLPSWSPTTVFYALSSPLCMLLNHPSYRAWFIWNYTRRANLGTSRGKGHIAPQKTAAEHRGKVRERGWYCIINLHNTVQKSIMETTFNFQHSEN